MLRAFFLLLLISASFSLSCQDEKGNAVAWWTALKFPEGTSYAYADSNNPGGFKVSPFVMNSTSSGALAQTLQQLYQGKGNGYFLYNDQPPTGADSDTKAHSKGVIVVTTSLDGFWLTHSVPRFPDVVPGSYSGVPSSESIYGQSMMCVTLTSSQMNAVAGAMLVNGPNVYSSQAPSGSLTSNLQAMFNSQFSGQPNTNAVSFAVGSTSVNLFSKSRAWNSDLFEDLVASTMEAGVQAETWCRGDCMPSYCPPQYKFPVQKIMNVSVLGNFWKETQDHSKWAVSLDSSNPFVCIADINRMTTQRKRGGGCICITDAQLWNSFSGFVTGAVQC